MFDRDWYLVRRIGELDTMLRSADAKNLRLVMELQKKTRQVDGLNEVQRELKDLVDKLKRENKRLSHDVDSDEGRDMENLGTVPFPTRNDAGVVKKTRGGFGRRKSRAEQKKVAERHTSSPIANTQED